MAQLQEICAAVTEARISRQEFLRLMDEVLAYLQAEVERFDSLPDYENERYLAGVEEVAGGLAAMHDATLDMMAYADEADPARLTAGLTRAAEADRRVAAGTRLLAQAAED